tara:strand:- start:179 stop:373 length:195 start_codon:yes stop_codon:yes gene_type:complete
MNTKFDGPLVSAFQSDPKGVVKQELITYRVRDGQFVKETTTRRFNEDQTNWHDTSSVEPLLEVE